MSNYSQTWVCLDCMESARSKHAQPRFCSKCKKEMISLSYKTEIPKKSQKLWNYFKNWLFSFNPYFKEQYNTRLSNKSELPKE
jgi:hypothetical protein